MQHGGYTQKLMKDEKKKKNYVKTLCRRLQKKIFF